MRPKQICVSRRSTRLGASPALPRARSDLAEFWSKGGPSTRRDFTGFAENATKCAAEFRPIAPSSGRFRWIPAGRSDLGGIFPMMCRTGRPTGRRPADLFSISWGNETQSHADPWGLGTLADCLAREMMVTGTLRWGAFLINALFGEAPNYGVSMSTSQIFVY